VFVDNNIIESLENIVSYCTDVYACLRGLSLRINCGGGRRGVMSGCDLVVWFGLVELLRIRTCSVNMTGGTMQPGQAYRPGVIHLGGDTAI
jgi:hypothetical protein